MQMRQKKHKSKQYSLFFLTAAILLLGAISILILSGNIRQPVSHQPKYDQKPEIKQEESSPTVTENPQEGHSSPSEKELFKKEILSEKITTYLEENKIAPDKISFCIRDISTGEETAFNETMDFTAASVYKLPLAMLYYEAVETGDISLETKLLYQAKAYEPGGPIGDNYAFGSKIPLETLLFHLLVHSDNTAGHILFESMGGWSEFRNQAQKYARHSLKDSFFSRKNILTAEYTADVLQYLL